MLYLHLQLGKSVLNANDLALCKNPREHTQEGRIHSFLFKNRILNSKDEFKWKFRKYEISFKIQKTFNDSKYHYNYKMQLIRRTQWYIG